MFTKDCCFDIPGGMMMLFLRTVQRERIPRYLNYSTIIVCYLTLLLVDLIIITLECITGICTYKKKLQSIHSKLAFTETQFNGIIIGI